MGQPDVAAEGESGCGGLSPNQGADAAEDRLPHMLLEGADVDGDDGSRRAQARRGRCHDPGH
ncbi:hypothetical protein [Streptomyces sp. NBC_01197]|uniref:hypothetical protein n=1 Tax=Streptomyces sp. NBC_01197 TaxID=2903768 RepID=UPI002E152571|nr:hypothetical protein OG452_01470 [Streptomyces sp. NBC_01197]